MRLFTVLLLLPLLGACTIEHEYYANDYSYQPPLPTARVDVPVYSFHHVHRRVFVPRYYHRYHSRPRVIIESPVQRNSHIHGPSTVVPPQHYNPHIQAHVNNGGNSHVHGP